MEFNVPASAAGTVTLTFRYANGLAPDRPANITVNGGTPKVLTFATTGTWDTWQTASVAATLHAGTNTVRVTATTTNGGPNLDSLAVS